MKQILILIAAICITLGNVYAEKKVSEKETPKVMVFNKWGKMIYKSEKDISMNKLRKKFKGEEKFFYVINGKYGKSETGFLNKLDTQEVKGVKVITIEGNTGILESHIIKIKGKNTDNAVSLFVNGKNINLKNDKIDTLFEDAKVNVMSLNSNNKEKSMIMIETNGAEANSTKIKLSKTGKQPVIYIDGKKSKKYSLSSIESSLIDSVRIEKNDENGVIYITTKKDTKPVIYVNGKKFEGELSDIPSEDIEEISVIKTSKPQNNDTPWHKNGVVMIKLKK